MPDAAAAVKATSGPAAKKGAPPSPSPSASPPQYAQPDPLQRVFNVLGVIGFLLAILSMTPVKDQGSQLISSLNALFTPRPVRPSYAPVYADDESAYENGCPPHQYDSVKIASRNPDIIIIEGFLSPFERQYLVDVAKDLFEESKTVDYNSEDGGRELDKTYRDSQSAYLPLPDGKSYKPLACIEKRASELQGHEPIPHMENLQVVRYGRGHFFREHYDWFDPDKDNNMGATGNRKTSIFAYLVAECQGGTTVFPRVKRPQAPEWCDSGLLKCVDDNGNDVEWLEVQPKEGVAIFWQNYNGNGELDTNTLHAGADVLNGTKYGLNIWTREGRFRYNDYE